MANSNYCQPWRGNTSGIATSPLPESLPRLINSFRITNKAAASIGVSVYLFTGSYSVAIMPTGLTLATNEMYEGTEPIIQLATEQIKVQVSGSVDYDFTLSNIDLS